MKATNHSPTCWGLHIFPCNLWLPEGWQPGLSQVVISYGASKLFGFRVRSTTQCRGAVLACMFFLCSHFWHSCIHNYITLDFFYNSKNACRWSDTNSCTRKPFDNRSSQSVPAKLETNKLTPKITPCMFIKKDLLRERQSVHRLWC